MPLSIHFLYIFHYNYGYQSLSFINYRSHNSYFSSTKLRIVDEQNQSARNISISNATYFNFFLEHVKTYTPLPMSFTGYLIVIHIHFSRP